MRDVATEGGRDQAAARGASASGSPQPASGSTSTTSSMSQEEQTKARIDRFRYLMNQARFELAYQEAQVMEQERVNRGLTVPPEVYATYRIGQSATQLPGAAGIEAAAGRPLPAHHDAGGQVVHPVPGRAAGPLPAGVGVAGTPRPPRDLRVQEPGGRVEHAAEPADVPVDPGRHARHPRRAEAGEVRPRAEGAATCSS